MTLLLIAFRNLFRNFRRTVSILLTVALGIGALFCFDGFINGVLDQYRDSTIHARYGHGQVNLEGYRDNVYEKPWEHWIEDGDKVTSGLKEIENIRYVFPRIDFPAFVTKGKITVSGLGQGVDAKAEANFFHSMNIESGKALDDEPNGILLGKGLAQALNAKVGDTVTVVATNIHGNLSRVNFKLVGIFHTGTKEFDDKMFRVPFSRAQEILNTSKIETIAIGLNSHENWEQVHEDIIKRFPNLDATSFDVLDAVYYQHSVKWLNSQFGTVMVIILTIVILGIFNSVSTTILERKQEIGNLRANGESMWDIMKLLLWEGGALGALGSFMGVALAFFLHVTVLKNGITMPPGPGLTRDFIAYLHLNPEMAMFVVLIGTAAAVVATFISGIRVARMPIGDALRSH